MTQKFKGIILGIDNILAAGQPDNAEINQNIFTETGRLIKFLHQNNIQPVVLANRDWFINDQRLEDFYVNKWGYFKWFIANNDNTPHKPSKDSINHVLNIMGWNKNETIYLGNTDADMKTAVNGSLLFLNAIWYAQTNDYGFEFKSPKDVARFIDIFCLRSYFWQYSICNQDLEYYALGIFGTRDPEYKIYTEDAKEAAKQGRGHLDFWLKYLVSSIYFSDLYKRIDYIAPYPGHSKNSSPTVMEQALIIFAKCFKIIYLKDLIVRHTTATKSAFARYKQEPLDCLNQMNTIHLNEFPVKKKNGERYKKSPINQKKDSLSS